jgi:DNA-binding MarR family transcriptional regulator
MNALSAEQRDLSHAVSELLSQLTTALIHASAADILRLLQCEDLSMPRLVTLMFLERAGKASISDISAYLNLSLGNTSHLVNQLVCGGYVTRSEDLADRRIKWITLTAQGQTFMQEIRQVRIEDMAQRLEHVPRSLLVSAQAALAALVKELP